MSEPLQEALRETQADLESASSHLALIRETIDHGDTSPSPAELARRVAVSLVTSLGFERVAIVLLGEDGEPHPVAAYGQTERFGGPREPRPEWAIPLAREVLDEGSLLRFGGEGVGARRRRPRDVDEDVIGLPLETGGEILGAVLCAEIATRPWNLIRHRSLELVGQCIAQVMALHRSRAEVESARRDLEAELRAARTRLQSQDERIDSLSSSLDVADRVKQTFLGLLSHELRTPLAAMLGYASMLRDPETGPLNDEQDGFLSRIETNGRRLGHLLDDLLFLTEAESTPVAVASTDVDLEPVVEVVRRALAAPPSGPPTKIDVAIAPGAERVRGDPTLLRRLLFHLLDDAARAAPGGAVRLEAGRAESDRVHLRVRTEGGTPDEPGARGLGPSLIRLCASLLEGRSRLLPRAEDGFRAEVWIPAATISAATRRVRKKAPAGATRQRTSTEYDAVRAGATPFSHGRT